MEGSVFRSTFNAVVCNYFDNSRLLVDEQWTQRSIPKPNSTYYSKSTAGTFDVDIVVCFFATSLVSNVRLCHLDMPLSV